MIPYARLKPGPGFQPVKAAGYYAQRLVVGPRLRGLIASSIAMRINAGEGKSPERIPERLGGALESLRSQGFIGLPSIAPAKIESLLARLASQQVIGSDGIAYSLEAMKPGVAHAAYPLPTLLACPELYEIADDPDVLAITSAYLGCRPTVASVGVRWSFPSGKKKSMAQTYHRDLDDWRSIKYFVYLTDVEPDTGPHMYVKGSHCKRLRFRARPYSDDEVLAGYGDGAVETVCGPKGRAFIADTLGIHRGLPPLNAPRLILQIQYSMLPVYAFDYHPLPETLPPGVDKYRYRLLAA